MMKSEVAKELDAELLRETHFYQLSVEQTAQALQVDADQGLSDAEAKARQARFGPNALEEKARKTGWQMFIEQLKSCMILILLIAALISGRVGEYHHHRSHCGFERHHGGYSGKQGRKLDGRPEKDERPPL